MTAKNILRTIWVVFVMTVLLMSLMAFDGKRSSDMAVFSAWSMIGLTAPAGLLVPLAYLVLYDVFQLSISTSYQSLFLDWLAFAVLGYLQWFIAVPLLIERVRLWWSHRNTSPIR